MIISVDFDGTLAITDYPNIISPVRVVINKVIELQNQGHTIILNTCRHDMELDNAVEWCKEQGVLFDYINKNTKELIEQYGDCRKIAADYYVDDKNISIKEFTELEVI